MKSLYTNIGILQEAKLMKRIYTRRYGNYSVITTYTNIVLQVVLFWTDNNLFKVEEVKIWPNIIAFQLVAGRDCSFIVGAYIIPSDLDALEEVTNV